MKPKGRGLAQAAARAAATCLQPGLMLRALLPLGLTGVAVALLGWATWEPAVAGTRTLLQAWGLLPPLLDWLDYAGQARLRSLLAPLVLVALVQPLLVVASLLMVAWLLTPAVARQVAARQAGGLQAWRATSRLQALRWALGSSVLALLGLACSLPLWLLPGMSLLLPALAWGWLTAQLLGFAVLADYASRDERRHLLRQQRWPLLAMGMACGAAVAVPGPLLLGLLGPATLILAPVLAVLGVVLYGAVFAATSAWFAQLLVPALWALRARQMGAASVPMQQAVNV